MSPGPTSGDRDLQSPRFAGDPVLENCLDGKQALKIGSSGAAVAKVQQALIDAGFPLPQFGPDGRFGGETHAAVKAFQAESGLTGKNVDGIVGRTTMGLLDARFLAAPPQPGTCVDGAINTDQDPLPDFPPFVPEHIPGNRMMDEVKKMLPPDQPAPKAPPPGASQPQLSKQPVTVTAIPVTGSSCVKCAADWDITATFKVLIATGAIPSNEPQRSHLFRVGDATGCPPSPFPQRLDVMRIIRPGALPFIEFAEMEHYLDFVRAFHIAAGRFLANVRRLTPARTHLFASSAAECDIKVQTFLQAAILPRPVARSVLLEYSNLCIEDFVDLYKSSVVKRDMSKAHDADPRPPMSEKPIFPNIDLAKNPFGCRAFFRNFDQTSFRGVPGAASDAVIGDTRVPPRRPWHAL